LPRQFQADISSATATLRQPQLAAPPSTGKTQIAHYKTTVPNPVRDRILVMVDCTEHYG
jgi:hypothetical protein